MQGQGPYSNGLSESFRNVCNKAGVQFHFSGGNTIKNLLMAPKDKDNITSKGRVIYRYKGDHPGYTVDYISKTGRTFGDEYKEHLRDHSPIHDHTNTTGHPIKLDNFSIMDMESQCVTRTLKEVMFIRVNDPSLHRKPWQVPITIHLG